MGYDQSATLYYGFNEPESNKWPEDCYEAEDKFCNIESFGNDSYLTKYVCVKESYIHTFDCKEVKSLEAKVYWYTWLKDFCAESNIPWQEPKWYISASYI